ncbi:MAG: lipid-binding SYLF domain-containing protein [Nitrospinae bacterium]|nr:lipid-binding SYLF domain-containing protein [Nitrospinota bacterium]
MRTSPSAILLTALLSAGVSSPAEGAERNAFDEEMALSRAIARFEKHQTNAGEARIPSGVLASAKGIVIFPSTAPRGMAEETPEVKGVASLKLEPSGKWGPPGFVRLREGEYSPLRGDEGTGLALLIMTDKGTRNLYGKKWIFGKNVAAADGPFGREAEPRFLRLLLKRHSVLSYLLSDRLQGGVDLQGALVAPDARANANFYGREISLKKTLRDEGRGNLPDLADRFMRTLNKLASQRDAGPNGLD